MSLCRLTTLILWFPLEVCGETVLMMTAKRSNPGSGHDRPRGFTDDLLDQ